MPLIKIKNADSMRSESQDARVVGRGAGRVTQRVLFGLGTAATLLLAGCGAGFVTDPGQVASTALTEGPAMGVSVYGGHAPLVGAKMYVLTPSTTADAGLVTSLMKSTTTNTKYPLTKDISGGATNGMYYVTTDQYGVVDLTGSYACTPNQPVYLAATGGAPSYAGAGPNTFALSSITVSNVTGVGNGTGTATYTFNVKSPATQLFYVGEQITFANTDMGVSNLNGRQTGFFNNNGPFTITGTGLTTASFQTTFSGDVGGFPAGTNPYFPAGTVTQPANATVTGVPANNPAAVNMAALGACPASGNFSTAGAGNGAISFIFMNEVSTAAMAYATAGFGSDAFHIGANQGGPLNAGTPNAALKGYVTGSMLQAFNNAYLLYDIQGGNQGTAFAGEGHIGRVTTPEGNGTTPQLALDTLGNILAACVDSANTSSGASTQCSTLFATATLDGTTTGTKPTDIAAAAFNIAHHPAGSGNASFMSTLFNLPVGNVPFLPQLSAQPSDFTLAIRFTVSSSKGGANLINNPQIVTLDGSPYAGTETGTSSPANSVWVGSFGSQTVKMFTNGTPDYTANSGGLAGTMAGRSAAFDSSNNPWILSENAGTVATAGAAQHFTNAGTLLTTVPAATNQVSVYNNGTYVAVDTANNIYIDNEDLIQKTNSSGVNVPYQGGGATAYWSANNGTLGGTLVYTNAVTLDSAGLVYTVNSAGTLCVANPTTAVCNKTLNGFSSNGPNNVITFPAVDTSDTFWSPNFVTNNIYGYNYVTQSGSIRYTCTGGGLSSPSAVAIDGANTIWVANSGAALNTTSTNSLSQFNAPISGTTCTALSPTTGYAALNGNPSLNSASLAIDRAGDIWVVYSGNYIDKPYLYEVIGIATPTVSPTAFATFNNFIGTRPL